MEQWNIDRPLRTADDKLQFLEDAFTKQLHQIEKLLLENERLRNHNEELQEVLVYSRSLN